MATYRALLDRASDVASQPYTPYGGDLSAGFNPQQNMGVAGINQNAGFALPFLQSAQGYATQAGAPITGDDIARYQNPYTQQVVDATQSHFDRQNAGQQNDLRSRAAMAGALGGSSPRIAAADMAYQQQQGQAPAIAGLYRQGFDTALSAAQRQQQQAGQTAGLMGNLGISGQQAMLSGAGAQFGVGQAEQTTQQQDLDRQYQQFQIQQAFPYQQTQWLAGIGTGVGSQMGGTGSTTSPKPSVFGQIAGLGLAGAGMFFNHGGRIRGFAPGGAVDATPYASAQGWIPQIGITRGSGPPSPPRPPAEEKQPDYLKGIAGFAKRPQDAGAPLVNYNPVQDVSNPHYGMGPELPSYYQTPGLRPIYRDGGRIAGFAEGGVPDDDPSFSDRWFPTIDAVRTGEFDVGGANYTPLYEASVGPTAGVDMPMPRPRPGGIGVAAGPGPMEGPALGFSGPAGASGDDLGSEGAAAYFPSLPEAQAGVAGPSQAPQGQRGGLGFIPEEYRMPLITAGLAMMASRSPHALSAIGEGGLAGVGAYSRQKQAQADADYNQRKFNLDARRLDQAAERAREDLALRTKMFGETGRHNRAMEDRGKFLYLGPSPDGTNSIFLNQITGDHEERPIQVAPKTPKAAKPIPQSVYKDLAKAGENYHVFTNLTEKFKPEFGGFLHEKVGDAANLAAKNLGIGDKDRADWWAQYQEQKNLIRNSLFGSALTRTEKTEFDKAAINPGMKSEMIDLNLQRQHRMAKRAAKKIAEFRLTQGDSPESVEAALGFKLSDVGVGQKESDPTAGDKKRALDAARAAINSGKSRDAVIKRLRENGIDPAGL